MTACRLSYATRSAPVVVSVEPRAAIPVASALFPDDRASDPGGEPFLTLVADDGGFALHGPGGTWRSSGLDALLVRLELSLAEELVRRSGLAGVHAGGVVVGGGTVLLPGTGGTGKSTLTVALAQRGTPVLGDDVVLLDPDARAHAFRRLLKVEGPARALLGLPSAAGPLSTAWPDATFVRPHDVGSAWAEPAPVRVVVLPRRMEIGHTELLRARASDVLAELVAGLVLSPRVAAGTFEMVAEVVASAVCWELRYATAPLGADALVCALE